MGFGFSIGKVFCVPKLRLHHGTLGIVREETFSFLLLPFVLAPLSRLILCTLREHVIILSSNLHVSPFENPRFTHGGKPQSNHFFSREYPHYITLTFRQVCVCVCVFSCDSLLVHMKTIHLQFILATVVILVYSQSYNKCGLTLNAH